MRYLLNEINKKNDELRKVQSVLWGMVDRKEIENELGSYCDYITFDELSGKVSFLGGDGFILTKDINELPTFEDGLIKDEDWKVKLELVRQGYCLDELMNDRDWKIRLEVARQGYRLDKLINDEDDGIRFEIAKQGFGLDKLINDKNRIIRAEVARQGHGLDKLIKDKDWRVRLEVARQGYRLDILVNDEDWSVREIAQQYIQNKT